MGLARGLSGFVKRNRLRLCERAGKKRGGGGVISHQLCKGYFPSALQNGPWLTVKENPPPPKKKTGLPSQNHGGSLKRFFGGGGRENFFFVSQDLLGGV